MALTIGAIGLPTPTPAAPRPDDPNSAEPRTSARGPAPEVLLRSELVSLDSGERAFWLRSTEPAVSPLPVLVHLTHLPCSGTYRYRAAGDQPRDDVRTTYRATVEISRFSGNPNRCGGPLPSNLGERGVTVRLREGADHLIDIEAERLSKRQFRGLLTIGGLPYCDVPYLFRLSFYGQRNVRYVYVFRVKRAHATYDGQPVPVQRCPGSQYGR